MSYLPLVSPAAGTDHEVAAASPSAAGSRGWWLRLEWGFLLRALQGSEARGAGPAGNAGGRKGLKAAAAKSPAAERPRESTWILPRISAELILMYCSGKLKAVCYSDFSFLLQHSGMSMGSSSMGGQWVDGVGMWGGPGGIESKGVSGGSSGSMGMWDEAVKNQASLRGNTNNNMGLKNSRSSPSLRYTEPD